MITSSDVANQVTIAIDAQGEQLAAGIDADAITREIIDTYGLVDIDTIDFDTFWDIVSRHDATQGDAIAIADDGDVNHDTGDQFVRVLVNGEEVDSVAFETTEEPATPAELTAQLAGVSGFRPEGDWVRYLDGLPFTVDSQHMPQPWTGWVLRLTAAE
jgi:hypothetical protein